MPWCLLRWQTFLIINAAGGILWVLVCGLGLIRLVPRSFTRGSFTIKLVIVAPGIFPESLLPAQVCCYVWSGGSRCFAWR